MNCSSCRYWKFFQTDRVQGMDWGICGKLEDSHWTDVYASNHEGEWVGFEIRTAEIFGCKLFTKQGGE